MIGAAAEHVALLLSCGINSVVIVLRDHRSPKCDRSFETSSNSDPVAISTNRAKSVHNTRELCSTILDEIDTTHTPHLIRQSEPLLVREIAAQFID